MNDVVSLKFGIFNDFTIPFHVGSINSVFPINNRECICSTSRGLYKIEKNEIKLTNHQITFSVCLLIPDTDILVGVTTRTNRLFVYQTTNLSQPIISNYATNHLGVFHIYYSTQSSSLILVGYGIKVFYLRLKYAGNRHSIFPPEVTIKLRSKFCDDFSPNLLIPVPFDYEHEYIFLPTKEGICPHDLDGNRRDPMSRYSANVTTVYFYNEYSRKIFTFDPNHGFIKWTQNGQIEQRFPSAGTSIVAMFLIDKENVVCYSSLKQIFLLNFVTGRTFFCYNLEKKPTRLFLIRVFNKPYLIVCQGATLIGLKIEIPWNVWCHPLLNCNFMMRCNQMNEAGRIFVQTKGNIIDLYSPSKGTLVSSATQKKAITPISFYYDRGFIQYAKKNYSKYELINIKIDPVENSLFQKDNNIQVNDKLKDNHRDILYFVFDDGTISGFYTGVSPCDEILSLNLKASFLCVVFYENHWCYAAVSKRGILSLFDYVSFEIITQLNIGYLDVIKLFYDALTQSLVIVNNKSTLIFDLQTKQIIDEIEITGSDVVHLFGDFIKFGYKSGHITTIYIENGKFNTHSMIDNRSHLSEVTGFSFSPEIWISSSLDCSLLAWNYHEEKLFQVLLPLPLTSCCIVNGYRDILVSTDSEIMKIEGKKFFLKFDDEIPEIDNYDKQCDYLEMPHYLVIADMMRKTKSKLSSSVKAKSTVVDSTLIEKSTESNANDNFAENFKTPAKTPPKVRNTADNEKIIQSMMEINGLKSPVIPQFKLNINQNDKKIDKSNINDDGNTKQKQIIETKQTSPKTFKKTVSAKDFLKSEIEKEKKFQSKPKRAKRKKNKSNKNDNQKADLNETQPIKSAIDLLSLMDRNKSDKVTTKVNLPKKGSTIDFSALAKQFQKVGDENENNHEYEYVTYSETESESESEQEKKKKKKKNVKTKKEKKKKLDDSDSISEEEVKKHVKNKVKSSQKSPKKIKSENNKKNKQNRIKKDNIKSILSSNFHQDSEEQIHLSQESLLLQNRGVQGDSLDDDDNLNDQDNENDKDINITEEEDEQNIITSDKDIENNATEEEESFNENQEDLNNNNNNNESNSENSKEEEEENSKNNNNNNINEEEEEEIIQDINSNDQYSELSLNSPINQITSDDNDDNSNKIQSGKDHPHEKIQENKPFNSLKLPKKKAYSPVGKFSLRLKHFEAIQDIRKRSSTPDPSYRPTTKFFIKQDAKIRRCFSSRPKEMPASHYEYDLDNIDDIPANIWIDDNALFEKYSILRTRKEDEKNASPPKLCNGVIFDDKSKENSNEKTFKLPQKPNSNFFRRKNISNKKCPENEIDNEKEIDATVRRLALNQYQLHQFQQNFQFNMKYDEYNKQVQNRNRPNNQSNIFIYNDYNETKNEINISQNFEYYQNFQCFTSSASTQNLNVQQNDKKQGAAIKVYKFNKQKNSSNNDENIQIKKRSYFEQNTSPRNISDIDTDKDDDNNKNEIESIKEPQIQNEPKSPRKISKSNSKIERKGNDIKYLNFAYNKSNDSHEVDQLEQEFMKKMPNFKMKNQTNFKNGRKKRPNSSRKISKPKLYLNPVYPPNRSRGIEGAIVHSSFSNANYY